MGYIYRITIVMYEVQETDSECPHCLKMRASLAESEGSSSDADHRHRIVIPLGKQILANNKHIQESLAQLQGEIEQLKRQNENKDRKIRRLQGQLRTGKQARIYPGSAKIGGIYHNNADTSRKTKRHQTELESYSQQMGSPRSVRKSNEHYGQYRNLVEVDEIQNKIREITQQKNAKILQLQGQLEKLGDQYREVCEKLQEQISDNQWLTKFCLTFVNMAGKISETQGESIVEADGSLRKNTKKAWKFFKEFIAEVIK